jgi:transcription termination factor Rho
MYEIATLKTKKLPELQDIAKKIGIKGIAGLKKIDLIYQIVDFIASRPEEDTNTGTSKEKTTSGMEKKGQIKILPVQKSQPKSNQDNQQQKK